MVEHRCGSSKLEYSWVGAWPIRTSTHKAAASKLALKLKSPRDDSEGSCL